jgi:heavy metal-(Cd/Co/Hg/Pb/Zn)-translocating P-type ATPase
MKRDVMRLAIGSAIYAVVILTDMPWYIFLIPYLIIGGDILFNAGRNIIKGSVFDENFLMALATVGAFCIGEPIEAVAVMLFYQVGEAFQRYAVGKSRKSITELMDIRPDYANIEVNGELTQVDPYDIKTGDIIVVRPGERVPLDGIIIDGNSTVDLSALTGESVPVDLIVGSDVISGGVNQSGLLKIEVTKLFEESTVSKILDMVENASSKKAKSENFITKFARYYTPIVVIIAVLIAVVPSIFTGDWAEWVRRAVILIFLSCPCALVISIPLSFFGGIGGASRIGVLVKGSNYLETLAEIETVVFDKTGTLTEGNFKVTKIYGGDDNVNDDVLMYAAHAEYYSSHPIAAAVREAYSKSVDTSIIGDIEEISGGGISAVIDNKRIRVGNSRFIGCEEVDDIGTVIYVELNGEYLGCIVISDTIKQQSKLAIAELRKLGINKTVMLTGDRKAVGETVAAELGIDEVHTELLPNDKVEIAEKLIAKGKTAFVGDGINDAPVLSRADVGIAMGGVGSDAAVEAADIVLMDDDPLKIASAYRIARKTLRIVRQNVVFALGVKFIVMILGVFGIAGMWLAVFADVGVSVIAIINAMRTLKSEI